MVAKLLKLGEMQKVIICCPNYCCFLFSLGVCPVFFLKILEK